MILLAALILAVGVSVIVAVFLDNQPPPHHIVVMIIVLLFVVLSSAILGSEWQALAAYEAANQ